MSFFNNFQADKFPGPLKGNPMNGICEKVCIQVKKVFDACIKQVTEEGILLELTETVPESPNLPLTFISAKNISSRGEIEDLSVTRLEEKPKFARVQCKVNIPMEVIFVDAEGTEGKGLAVLTVPIDVVLHIPEPSIIPYMIEAITGVICPEGKNPEDKDFVVTGCITVIMKVVVEAELLVPSYGYCPIPPCQEFNQEVCSTFFELPLFPRSGE